MSRYTLLLLLNLPFILLGLISAITSYKLNRSTRKRTSLLVLIWLSVLLGLLLAEPLYNWLASSGYTQTESLSLFDVVQITALVVIFYIVNRLRAKLEALEKRQNDIHQEVSIRLSTRK